MIWWLCLELKIKLKYDKKSNITALLSLSSLINSTISVLMIKSLFSNKIELNTMTQLVRWWCSEQRQNKENFNYLNLMVMSWVTKNLKGYLWVVCRFFRRNFYNVRTYWRLTLTLLAKRKGLKGKVLEEC